ncbi:50S ribosomal protein L18 [bacterium]|nr:50S ribosomal protein L18 [bacterium]
MADKNILKCNARDKRRKSIRKKIFGTAEAPRLSVFRSLKNIYAQLIDDANGITLVALSTNGKEVKSSFTGKPVDKSFELGKKLAELALAKEITCCIFDRGGYRYHGRVKALADGAREGGLQF